MGEQVAWDVKENVLIILIPMRRWLEKHRLGYCLLWHQFIIYLFIKWMSNDILEWGSQ